MPINLLLSYAHNFSREKAKKHVRDRDNAHELVIESIHENPKCRARISIQYRNPNDRNKTMWAFTV
jgi:hypothetical protein